MSPTKGRTIRKVMGEGREGKKFMEAKRLEEKSCKPNLKKKILAEELTFKVRGDEFNVKFKKNPSSAELREQF